MLDRPILFFNPWSWFALYCFIVKGVIGSIQLAIVLLINSFFLNWPTPATFSNLFSSFPATFYIKTVVFSGIRTEIIGVGAWTLTTRPLPQIKVLWNFFKGVYWLQGCHRILWQRWEQQFWRDYKSGWSRSKHARLLEQHFQVRQGLWPVPVHREDGVRFSKWSCWWYFLQWAWKHAKSWFCKRWFFHFPNLLSKIWVDTPWTVLHQIDTILTLEICSD